MIRLLLEVEIDSPDSYSAHDFGDEVGEMIIQMVQVESLAVAVLSGPAEIVDVPGQ